jgi:hypothetical protein
MSPAAARPVCRRCGRCCRLGGPALHTADLPLILQGRLTPAELVTLRRGEGVTDNVAGTVGPTRRPAPSTTPARWNAAPFFATTRPP